MFKKLLFGLLAIAAIGATTAARQGATFTVARSIDIHAAPARLAPLLDAVPTPRSVARLLHDDPATQSTLTATPVAKATRVTWRISGPLTLRARLLAASIGMDALLGSDLEKGLAGVKAAAEK